MQCSLEECFGAINHLDKWINLYKKMEERAFYYMSLMENAFEITINQSLKERSEQISLQAL